MRHRRAYAAWLIIIAVTCCEMSCSQHGPLQPVQGKVLYKGQPLSGAQVTLLPNAASAEPQDFPTGVTNIDGVFSLKTGNVEGAEAGQYKVIIVCLEAPKAKPGEFIMGAVDQEDRLRGAYATPENSKLTVEIKSGANQLDPFNLK